MRSFLDPEVVEQVVFALVVVGMPYLRSPDVGKVLSGALRTGVFILLGVSMGAVGIGLWIY